MSYFTLGTWVVGLAIVVSVAGAVVGLACLRQSMLSATSWFRMIWRTAAAVSFAGTGTWLPIFITMLGLGPDGPGVIRFDLPRLTLSMAIVVAVTLAALLLLGARATLPQLALACAVAGAGVAVMHVLMVSDLTVQGSVRTSPFAIAAVAVLSLVLVAATLAGTLRTRTLPGLTAVAVAFAVANAGVHYLGLAGVSVRLDHTAAMPTGSDLFSMFVPLFVLGTLTLAVPITAVLVAPDRKASQASASVPVADFAR
ncbi:MHYT domain-containing protein [Nocardia stercoris]|uniref:MHYT domain-containing protein n=1 Tax=Nocardia stercoris TaxID=2483361 RepID=A0A3M2KT52_9NOCA|nr:MHYT domain-containing protein [Nocardia stercoris]RMI28114.1 hypothetical protein EBN03_31515 [Nocardia stercoris]